MLIGAVRGGHVEIVRALLQKYADIDIRGQVCVVTVLVLALSMIGHTCGLVRMLFFLLFCGDKLVNPGVFNGCLHY